MKKKMRYLLLVFAYIFLLNGCVLDIGDEMELTKEDYDVAQNTQNHSLTGQKVEKVETITIYSIDYGQEELIPLKTQIDANRITPEFIMDEVVRNQDEKIEVTEIELKKSCLYVTFNSQYAPIKKCSEKVETLILDCISNSIMDNLNYVDSIVFRTDQGAYRSANYSFGYEEVYSSK